MSNALVITVTKFQPVDESDAPTFGYTASDSYGSDFNNVYESLETFKEDFPDKDELILHVLSTETFKDCAQVNADGTYELDTVSSVTVFGYD